MKRILLCTLLLLVLTAISTSALAISGQPYETFLDYYEDDLEFINENANRHLLPLVVAKRDSDERDGRILYEIYGDVLSLTIRTDPTGEVIEMCQIIMTAPVGMEYGDSAYNDFAISGYHSYAMLMAMDARTEASERYNLVTSVVEGMAANEGQYSTQVGVYTLTCTRVNNVATLTFENSLVPAPEESVDPDATADPDATPAPENDDDEGAGLG